MVATTIAKRRRAKKQQARRITKQSWTRTTIRATQEKMPRLVKSVLPRQDTRPRFGLQALRIAKQNRLVAKAR